MVFQSSKNGVKLLLNFESSWEIKKKYEATFCRSALLLSFCENRFRLLQFVKKLNSTIQGAFSTFLRFQGDHYYARVQKWCLSSYFSKSIQTKKLKKVRSKITEIA